MRQMLVGVSLLLMLTSAGCGGAPNAVNPETSGALETVPAEYAGKQNPLGPEAAAAGAQPYQSNCEACHGSQGHGDGPAGVALEPAPKNLAELNKTAADDY